MDLLRSTLSSPAENLACDEALLEICERTEPPAGVLRFWESTEYFVVLGYAKRLVDEIKGHACQDLGIPILRRCSGGGTILQGPGCLNFSIVFPISLRPELETISSTNQFIMQRHKQALSEMLGREVQIEGHTDLAIQEKKFSGNSQRRKRHCLLFHGSFLLNFELELIEKTLRNPGQQPDYRKGRSHMDFLMNLMENPQKVQKALQDTWESLLTHDLVEFQQEAIRRETKRLAEEKYNSQEWTRRF